MNAVPAVLVAVGGLLCCGCAGVPRGAEAGFAVGQPEAERIAALAADLTSLEPQRGDSRAEAELIARVALQRAAVLREQFQPVDIPIINNVFVNLRWRARGLCYEWTNDLLEPLEALGLRHFDLHWANAFWGDESREHNAVVVCARGAAFADGLVLDGWRRGGRLVWVHVKSDTRYPWRELTVEELRTYRPGARR